MTTKPTVSDVPRRNRYEIDVSGRLAGYAGYKLKPGQVVFLHTEIDQSFEGQGLGSVLAKGALDDVRARGLEVVPLCPFIKGWIARHPDYADLVHHAPSGADGD